MPDPISNVRAQQAAKKACDSYAREERVANALLEELDEVTPIEGVPIAAIDDEDSAVIAIGIAITENKKSPRARTEPGAPVAVTVDPRKR